MYKLQKYRKQKVSRKRGTSRSLYRKTRGRHRRVKTKQCRIRRCTRISRKYTIKKGNNRVRKNAQRGGGEPESTISRKNDDPSDQSLAREIVAEAKENEKAKILISQLKRYIHNQYPDDFKRVDSNLNFIIHATGKVTKINPDTLKSPFLSEMDRPEELYIFTMGNYLGTTIFYIVRCAKPEGCSVRCSTATDGGIGSICSKINKGISRPLKGMESEVLRLHIDTVREKTHPHPYAKFSDTGSIRFAGVNSSKYYIIDFELIPYDAIIKELSEIDVVEADKKYKPPTTDTASSFFDIPDIPDDIRG